MSPVHETASPSPETFPDQLSASQWRVASETGRLEHVLLCRPDYLTMVPCNAVTRNSIAKGLESSVSNASKQHRQLDAALKLYGVQPHFVDPAPGLADMTFTRDAALMSPWGLIELRPAATHRQEEARHVAQAVTRLGARYFGRVREGRIEGGDVCLLRDGVILIGVSEERTDREGAEALGAIFRDRGWQVILTRFDPQHLHLDTLLTVVSERCVVACREALEPELLSHLRRLGIWVIPASLDEVKKLGANLFSVGENRLIVPSGNTRLTRVLRRCWFEVTEVDIDEFTQCGGGVHCLTMPLARTPTNSRSALRSLNR